MSIATDLAGATALDLAAAIRQRDLSAVEAVEGAISRIELLNGLLNAVVTMDFDRAIDAAALVDGQFPHPAKRPLLGVPITVKEAHNVAGLPTTWGLPQFENFIAASDSAAVERLKAAGAIVLGKTNVPVLLADWQSFNPIHGRTNNPWNPGRTPGGSSGGGAAAVASGMVPLECGSDLAGSLRIPAAFCGVCSHKPSYGLIPMRGFTPPGVDSIDPPLAVLGPIARSVEDLALALEVLSGPIEPAARAWHLELPRPRKTRLDDYRVLVLDEHPHAELDDGVRMALESVAEHLAASGTSVSRRHIETPDLGETLDCFSAMVGTFTSRGARGATTAASAHAWLDLLDQQARICARWAELFRNVDVVIAPTFGTTAFPHDESAEMNGRSLEIAGRKTSYAAQGAWSSMASLAQLPATTIPVALDGNRLPVGVQIIGPCLEDLTTLAFAGLLERDFGRFSPPCGEGPATREP